MWWRVGRFGLRVLLVALVFSTMGALLGLFGQMGARVEDWTELLSLAQDTDTTRHTRSVCDIEPPFIKLDELFAVNFSQRVPAPGCPPEATGRLCRLQDVFDEIILISLPRFTSRLARARAQLRDLGVPYTLIHAFDAKGLANAADLAKIVMHDPREQHPGVFSLYLTHMGVLAYIERSPSERVLILEDDFIFCADFPRAFDTRVRRIPDDWRMLWLGALVEKPTFYTNHELIERFSEVNYARPRIIATAWAVGMHRDAAKLMARSLETSREAMDRQAFVDALKKWPMGSYIMWPPVAATNPYSGSTLGHSWPIAPADWARDNGLDLANFDFQRGYHRGGELGADLRCVVEDRGEGAAWEYPAESVVSEAVEDTADQCCAKCSTDWPRCQAWQWSPDSGRCVLANAWAAEAATNPSEVVSGRIVQEDSPFRVPNVVHFVYTPRLPRLDVWVYISVLSAAINTEPDAIRWHHRALPQGPWWDCTRPLLTSLDVVDDVTSIHGQPFPTLSEAHKSDIIRLQVLMREGGIYLDTDALVLRSFDPLRTRNAVSLAKDGAVPDDKIPLIGSGVLVAPPNASFLHRWWAEFRTFDNSKWNVHSCKVPRQLAESHPDEANLLPHTAFYPRSWQPPHLAIAHKADDCRSEADSYAVHRYNSAVDGTAKGKWAPPTHDDDVEGDGAAELEDVWLGKGSLHRVARKILRKALAAGRLCPLAERVVRPLAAQGDEPKCVPATKVPDPTIPRPKPSTEQQNRNDDKKPADQAPGADKPKNDQRDTQAAEKGADKPKNDQSDTQTAEKGADGGESADKATTKMKVAGGASDKKKSTKAGNKQKNSKAGGGATLDDLLQAGMFGKKALGK
jgi:GR25 family glycosyltransferase involved in LPS biosynthesis